jgi:hypothetical protein
MIKICSYHIHFQKKIGIDFFIGFFNKNTQEVLYIIAIYKPLQMNTIFFTSILKNIIIEILTNCQTMTLT